MSKFAPLFLVASALALSGCDWFQSTSSADTKMENVEILPGTVSDEMITLDQASGDGTAIDASTAVGPGVPGTVDPADKNEAGSDDGDTPTSSEDAADVPEAGSGDVVIRPPVNGAEPDAPAKK